MKKKKKSRRGGAVSPSRPETRKKTGLSQLGEALLDALKRANRQRTNDQSIASQATQPAKPETTRKAESTKPAALGRAAPISRKKRPTIKARKAKAVGGSTHTNERANPTVTKFIGERGSRPLRTERPTTSKTEGPNARECAKLVEEHIAALMRAGKDAGTNSILIAPKRAELDELPRRLQTARGHQTLEESNRPPLEVHLGIDFGTSSTKIVAGLPFEAGAPSYAVPALDCVRMDDHPYLWASRLWISEDGACAIVPIPGALEAARLKAGLMLGREQIGTSADGSNITPEEAVCAFLALHLQQSKGWLLSEHRAIFGRRRVDWFVNFGFPAATLDDARLATSYRRCCAGALQLGKDGVDVTLSRVRDALAATFPKPALKLADLQGSLSPEIAAAVAGFAHSQRLEEEGSMFAMIDVGSTTVDCCTFRLFKDKEGEARCPILEADVRSFGVEPWRMWKADGGQPRIFRSALDGEFCGVIWRTRTDRNPHSKRWKEGLPVFFAGGGIGSTIHRKAVEGLDPWLKKHDPHSSGVLVCPLEPPRNLQHPLCDAEDVHRLCVAVGLSRPSYEIPRAQLPSTIEDVSGPRRVDFEDRFVGPEQT